MIDKSIEINIEEKLKNLYRLQLVDSRIDEIRNLRGILPKEIESLQEELNYLLDEIKNIQNEISFLEKQIQEKRLKIKSSDLYIKKFKIQQNKVRNNKDFEFLNKEIEYQELEIELSHKRIKEYFKNIDQKKIFIQEKNNLCTDKAGHLYNKKIKLEKIISENKEEEERIIKVSNNISKTIDPKLLQIYRRIRKGAKNGLAVVPVKRGASVGSYLFIPPQVHSDLIQRKNIIIDEHSGRILVDSGLAEEIEKEVIFT